MQRASVVLLAPVLALAACGGSSSKPKAPQGKPDPAAARAAQQYVDAYSAKQPAKICKLLAAGVRAQLTQRGNCVKTVRSTLRGASPKLTVGRAYRQANTATVTFRGSQRHVVLTREGGAWKVIDGGT